MEHSSQQWHSLVFVDSRLITLLLECRLEGSALGWVIAEVADYAEAPSIYLSAVNLERAPEGGPLHKVEATSLGNAWVDEDDFLEPGWVACLEKALAEAASDLQSVYHVDAVAFGRRLQSPTEMNVLWPVGLQLPPAHFLKLMGRSRWIVKA